MKLTEQAHSELSLTYILYINTLHVSKFRFHQGVDLVQVREWN